MLQRDGIRFALAAIISPVSVCIGIMYEIFPKQMKISFGKVTHSILTKFKDLNKWFVFHSLVKLHLV